MIKCLEQLFEYFFLFEKQYRPTLAGSELEEVFLQRPTCVTALYAARVFSIIFCNFFLTILLLQQQFKKRNFVKSEFFLFCIKNLFKSIRNTFEQYSQCTQYSISNIFIRNENYNMQLYIFTF